MKRFLALGLLCSSCYHGHPHYDSPPIYAEIEPNDSALEAPLYAGLHVGSAFSVRGHIDDFGPDLFDGVAVRANEPVEIRFDLYSDYAGTDLDVCVYDPDLDQYVVCEDGLGDPEHGSVVVIEPGKVIHLVVTSAWGDAGYRLDVHATVPSYPLASEPRPSAANAPDEARAAKRTRADAYRRHDAVEADAEPSVERRIVRLRVFDLDSGDVHDEEATLTRVHAAR